MKATCFRKSISGKLYSGFLAHYHIHADLDLGIGKIAVWRIPCGCTSCLDEVLPKLDTENALSPKQATISACNTRYKFRDVFRSFNDLTSFKLKSSVH